VDILDIITAALENNLEWLKSFRKSADT